MSSTIFGPVPSRRLGRSLGVDLVPYKTCTYDCIYCQLGRTTCKTSQRREWTPPADVLEELPGKLAGEPDYITLSGSGEPTLYLRIGELIARIKEMTDVPVAVLTNGSLLWLPEVRRALLQADLVVPSLDAGSDWTFQYVNRPDPAISFETMLEGLARFRQEYSGAYWLEVFLIGGITTTEQEIKHLSDCLERIAPDRVQLNTVTRPPAENFALPVPQDQVMDIASKLSVPAEVIADYRHVHAQTRFVATAEDILRLVQRRPCTIDDIAEGLGLHRHEVLKYVEDLSHQGRLVAEGQNNRLYYKIPSAPMTNLT
ncbi:MAG: radical SAM protein [Sedimentisphaerales bacterium]|nr:radical SAM protein [Sedimentisphaerales bacterium]